MTYSATTSADTWLPTTSGRCRSLSCRTSFHSPKQHQQNLFEIKVIFVHLTLILKTHVFLLLSYTSIVHWCLVCNHSVHKPDFLCRSAFPFGFSFPSALFSTGGFRFWLLSHFQLTIGPRLCESGNTTGFPLPSLPCHAKRTAFKHLRGAAEV